jgi:predicted nucleic-acid-binding Zn-ribbon protein
MSNYLVCPKCGNAEMVRQTRDLVRLVDTGETIIDQAFDSLADGYEYECAACGAHFDGEDDLKAGPTLTPEQESQL